MRTSQSPAIIPLPKNTGSGKRFAQKKDDQRTWFNIVNSDDSESDTAVVYIFDEIGFWGVDARSFVRELMLIDKPKIELHLNSPGGEVFDGVAIYNALKAHAAEVTVIVESLAASAASFIAQAGDKVIMRRNATMMIHDALAVCYGNEKEMLETANILGKISNNIADIYAQRAGEDLDFWRELMKEEVWYSAEEAVSVNLADEVDTEEEGASPEDTWDLSVYNFGGRSKAPSPEQVRKLVFNRAKERNVTAPKNTGPVEPEAESTEASEVEAPETEEVPEVEAPSAPEAPETPPTNKAKSGSPAVMINGVAVTDPAKIQAYIAGLEGAAKETKANNRKAFIKNLCDSNKILASQVAGLESFVVGTEAEPGLSDKQYDAWVASWDAAPSVGVLGRKVADGVTNPSGTNGATDPAEQDILDAVEIVRQHQRANMPKDQLEKTSSYQKLVAANALDKLK